MNYIKKKKMILASIVTVFLFCIFTAHYNNIVATILPARNHNLTIVIDPGHGGYDPGKVGINNVLEKDINLAISFYLKEYLTLHNYNVVMTRENDTALCEDNCIKKKTDDLNHRIDIIEENKPFVTVSIHQNSFSDSSVCGPQVFYYDNSGPSGKIANSIQDSIISEINPVKKRAPKQEQSYYILKNTTFPTVLVECGFLSNPSEASLLSSEKYQMQIAYAICIGIDNYVNSLSH